jgi:hypothetical protein
LKLKERPSYPRLLQQIKPGPPFWTGDKKAIHEMASSSISPEDKIKEVSITGKGDDHCVFWDCDR